MSEEKTNLNFIEEIIEKDLKEKYNNSKIITRFPPEPNGYLHIGHAKAICLNFGLAKKYNGQCNLRFDDTNPVKEDIEYVDSIREDVKWLGFEWGKNEFYASNYFEQLYDYAIKLIKLGKAFVCDLSSEQISENRGTPTRPGIESPFRNRSIEENLILFEKMRNGEFAEGEKVLRAKIDMSSPNMHMRDPALYRIKFAHHHNTGNKWCIYPMYDFAHGLSDSIEGVTHSICTLEFEVHRPLYEWINNTLDVTIKPQQIEFARLNISYTIMSKRKLLQLVEEKHVSGWDDPRMPTISGLRRRGYTPESLRTFAETIGVAKRENIIDVALLEHCIREDLNKKAYRVMGIIDPLKITIENYPEGKTELLEATNNPENPEDGTRQISFSKEIYIERNDFMEDAPKKYFRLAPGREVRLRYAYFIICKEVVKNEKGEITELICTFDPESKGGKSPDGRKVKGTIHWVNANDCIKAQVNIYDKLFVKEIPEDVQEGETFLSNINPDSLVKKTALVEKYLLGTKPGDSYQFERVGYFCTDKDSTDKNLIFNKTVGLKDSWSKMVEKGKVD